MKIPCQNRVPKEWGKGRSQTGGSSSQPPSPGFDQLQRSGETPGLGFKRSKQRGSRQVKSLLKSLLSDLEQAGFTVTHKLAQYPCSSNSRAGISASPLHN